MTINSLSFVSARAAGLVTTNQIDQFRAWIAAIAALPAMTAGHDGAEQVARICRQVIARDFHASPRQWSRLQSAYWISTDGYGRLIPARLALIPFA